MRVVHIASSLRGGAGIATRRLSEALNAIGVESTIVCRSRSPDASSALAVDELEVDSVGVAEQRIGWLFQDAVQGAYIAPNRSDMSNTLFTLDYVGIPLAHLDVIAKADVINLHWVSYFQSTETLAAMFALGKPIVWTMHDMNPFTGGCHYSAGCTHYTTNCSRCPQLSGDPAGAAALHLAERKAVYRGAPHLAVVTPSVWLTKEARRSAMLSSARLETISNSVDSTIFCPDGRAAARHKLGVADNAVCIAFAPLDRAERRKGFAQLAAALSAVAERTNGMDVRLVVLGDSAEATQFPLPTIVLPTAELEEDVAAILSACDISITPSLEDNLPNTILEAMACGVPVVAFDVGGARDALVDGESGMLVAAGDSAALADRLVSLVNDRAKREAMGQAARRRAVSIYAPKRQAEAYRALYSSMSNTAPRAAPPQRAPRAFESVPGGLLATVWPTFLAYITSAHQDALDQIERNRIWAEATEESLRMARGQAASFEDWAKRSDATVKETKELLEDARRWATRSDEELVRERERADEMEKWARKSDDALILRAAELQEALAWAKRSDATLEETKELLEDARRWATRSDEELVRQRERTDEMEQRVHEKEKVLAQQAIELEQTISRMRASDAMLAERNASLVRPEGLNDTANSLLRETEVRLDAANADRDSASAELATLQIRYSELKLAANALESQRTELNAHRHELEATMRDIRAALSASEAELDRTSWKRRWARWTRRSLR